MDASHFQDLKPCEGFPREGSSPSLCTIKSIGYENAFSPEKARIGYLHKSICERPKHVFRGPSSTHCQRNRLDAFTQDTLRSRLAVSNPFLDQPNVIRVLDGLAHLDRPSRASLDPLLKTLMSPMNPVLNEPH